MMNVMADKADQAPKENPPAPVRPPSGPDPMKSERRSGPRPSETRDVHERPA